MNEFLKTFKQKFTQAVNFLLHTTPVIDRLEITVVIKQHLTDALHLTDPAARAANSKADTRIDHPYEWYGQLSIEPQIEQSGDVLFLKDSR